MLYALNVSRKLAKNMECSSLGRGGDGTKGFLRGLAGKMYTSSREIGSDIKEEIQYL